MSSTYDSLGVMTTQEIYEKQVRDMQHELNWAHERRHDLHDVINRMKDYLQLSIDISEDRWKDYDGEMRRKDFYE